MRRWSEINWRQILRMIGVMLLIEGFAIMAGIPFSLYYGSHDIHALWVSGVIAIVAGIILRFIRLTQGVAIGKREGFMIVSFSWVVISLFGSLPYMLSGVIPDFSSAFFETISGFTTTGATVLTDIESVPKGILFWRSVTHFIGGLGIIVLSLAVLPYLGFGASLLFAAEMPNVKTDKLHPRIAQTAQSLWLIYFGFIVVLAGLFMAGGLSFFDSLCHSFSTMASGGFSTFNDSAASFSPYLQYVTIVFMIIAGTNFSLHYLLLHRYFIRVYRNEEFRHYIFIIFFTAIVIAILLITYHDLSVEQAFRDALFQVVSIITTTGFISSNYLAWKPLIWFIIFLLMFLGGSAGSTSGGIKVVRVLMLFKSGMMELKRLIHPRAIIPVRLNGQPVSNEIVARVMVFFFFYMMLFLTGGIVMSFMGLDFETAIGTSIAALGNVGPGIGSVGPAGNYSTIPAAGKWVLSFLMLTGRLEIFTVLVLLSPGFWRR